MHLLNLPLEIFREIIKLLVGCCNRRDLGRIKLINKLIAREIIDPVCSKFNSKFSYIDEWMAFAPYYVRQRALAPDSSEDNIVIRSVRDTSYKMVDYLNPTGKYSHEKLRQTTLLVSRAAVSIRVRGHMGWILDEKTRDVFKRPLFNAASQGHLEIARYLLRGGAHLDPDIRLAHEKEVKDKYSFCGYEYVEYPYPDTPLEAAALGGNGDMVQLLLSHPGTNSSYSYLHAIKHAARSGNIDLLKLLHAEAGFSGMSKNIPQTLWNHTLLSAAYDGKNEAVSYALDMGAELDYMVYCESYSTDTTALGFAAMRGHNGTIRLLLKCGADINGASGGCNSEEAPLLLASVYGLPRTVALLLDEGASMSSMETYVLSWALLMLSSVDCIRVFLEKGCHKRSQDGGKAALGAAVKRERQEVVALFKTFGITLDE